MKDTTPFLIIPDIHHRTEYADKIRERHPGIPAIYLGDYFDNLDDTPAMIKTTCKWLQRGLNANQNTYLLGNHCFAYVSSELGVRWGAVETGAPTNRRYSTSFSPIERFYRRVVGWWSVMDG